MQQMKLSLTLLLFLLPGIAVIAGMAAMTACRAPASPAAEALATPANFPSAANRPAPPPATSVRPPVVVFLGDSLTAGLGLEEPQAYPALLGARFAAQGRPIRVINAGVSGDTTAGGVRRLDWLLRQKPDVVVVGLGANDALRGAPPEEIERNLREILTRSRAAGARVLLLGMMIPPNYGPDYAGRFTALYPRIKKDMGVPLMPFLLDKVGGIPELNQADGIHPTAAGQRKVAENVYPYLRDVLAGTRTATDR
jgi:acyl-CoA thioesterase-1